MSNEIYGHLITLNLGVIPSFQLTNPINSLGRAKVNTIVIQDVRISTQHCQIIFEGNECVILDTSSNGTFINNEKIGKGNKSIIKDGDQLYLLHPTLVQSKELIGFTFKIANKSQQPIKGADQVIQPQDLQIDSINSQIHRQQNSNEKNGQQNVTRESLAESVIIKEQNEKSYQQKQEEKIEKQEQQKPKQNTDLDLLGEEIVCTICDDYVFEAVSINPCSHHFCGACLASWMKKKLECPNCRETIKGVQKSILLNNLVEKYLNAHEDKKRSPQAYEKMKEDNIFYNQPKKYEQVRGLIQEAREEDDGFVSNQENNSDDEDQENPYNYSENSRSHNSEDEDQELQHFAINQQNIFQQQQQQRQQQQQQQQLFFQPVGLFGNPQIGRGPWQQNNNIFGNAYQQQQLFNHVWPQQQMQQQFQVMNPNLCKSCNGQMWKGFQCQPDQEHAGCSSCGRKMPKRNLTEEENEEQKMFCCICKTYNCRYYYGDCQFGNQNKFILIKDLKAYFSICSPQINYIEQRRIIQHLGGKAHSTIFDFMMTNYISQRLFYFQQNKATFDHPLIEIDTLITPNTPICYNCSPKICSQIVWKYVSVNKFDEGLFMNPECWFGINCRNQRYPNHSQQYSHMCEQTKFE